VGARGGLALAASQREALRLALCSKVLVITDGPGVALPTPADLYEDGPGAPPPDPFAAFDLRAFSGSCERGIRLRP
jgi:hypothetical protein